MPRPRRSGLNVVRKVRADGSTVEYFYNRETKEFLGHDRAVAEEAMADANDPAAPAAPEGTIGFLIDYYLASARFRKRKSGTQTLYRQYLRQIRAMFGDLHASQITSGTIEILKDHLQDQPGKANMTLAMMRLLLGIAVRLGFVKANAASKPGRIESPPRIEIWALEDEQRFLEAARPSLQLAFLLLLYTVQRPSDVLAMRGDRITERATPEGPRLFVALRQRKTDELLEVPIHRRLEPLIRQRLAQDPHGLLVTSPRGKQWPRRNFSRAWDRVVRAAGIESVQRRDLRRTGIVRLAEAGATTPQIAALSGHQIDYCQRIIDTYLPRRTEVALGGIELWERAGAKGDSKIVQLASKRRRS